MLLNNNPSGSLWILLLAFLHWLWSIRWFLLSGALVVWFQWVIKSAVREGVEEAMRNTVMPGLNDIENKLDDIHDVLREDEE